MIPRAIARGDSTTQIVGSVLNFVTAVTILECSSLIASEFVKMIYGSSTTESRRSPLPASLLYVFIILSQLIFFQTASACGWWGDGEGDDDENVILVGKDGKPLAAAGDYSNVDPAQLTRIANVLRRQAQDSNDLLHAARMYRRAAETGFVPAQNNLAIMYDKGMGVPMNLRQAARWYQSAAEAGFVHAQHSFGEMLLDGRGVGKDTLAGTSWVRRAANQGHKSACIHLVQIYWEGVDVPREPIEALVWAIRAEALGAPGAHRLRTRILSALTAQEIDLANKTAHQWQPKPEYLPVATSDRPQ
jgi:TPR repeat protein